MAEGKGLETPLPPALGCGGKACCVLSPRRAHQLPPKQRHMAWPKVLCSLPHMLLSPVESQGRPAPCSGSCGHPLTLFSSDLWRTNPFLCWGEVLTLPCNARCHLSLPGHWLVSPVPSSYSWGLSKYKQISGSHYP